MGIKKKTIAHSCRVADICNEFANKMGLDTHERKILMYSAFLHDIFKEENNSEHHIMASDWVRENNDLPKINGAWIADVIECHKGKFEPDKENWLLAAILRMSDKIDKYNKGKDDADEKCVKSLEKIETWFNKEIDDEKKWAEFKTAYEQIRDKVKQKANM